MPKTIGILGNTDLDNLVKIWNDYQVECADKPAVFLCHPDTQKKLIELIENYCQQSGITKIASIFGIDVYESKFCPPGQIRIIPHWEWLKQWPRP